MRLGFPHPDYLLECLTSSQISEWLAFYSLKKKDEDPNKPQSVEEQRSALLAMAGGRKSGEDKKELAKAQREKIKKYREKKNARRS